MPVTVVPTPGTAAAALGGGNAPLIYVADPNAEGLLPANTALPAYTYSLNVSLPSMNWNPNTHQWQ